MEKEVSEDKIIESQNNYPSEIQSLPITPYLDDICDTLKNSPSHFLVLTAETAAGKSTAMPLALLNHFSGNIVMLEPRRLAVLNIASRVADLLGEQLGETCGYQMHLESKTSAKTRFTVLTEAILTRKLQNDPSLEGTSVVVIDEFHERSVHADLALAFLKESMEMRNDLFVIVMSATINTEKIAHYLGKSNDISKQKNVSNENDAPVFHVPGRQFPVTIEYAGDKSPSQAVIAELKKQNDDGSILVFLPGIADIRRTKTELEEANTDAEILVLHSSVSFEEQKKVLSNERFGNKRRVILSSAIAETSLTVPDVTVVIDSGLSRVNSFNRAAGMETLVTRSESVFNAEQRAGRAGRVAPGRCVRLWKENDVRTSEVPPEILRTDLTPLVLECAEWGVTSLEKLSWLDEPQEASWETSEQLLQALGCVSAKTKQITKLGKAALALGLHPRLACVVLSGVPFGKSDSSIQQAVKYSAYKDSYQQKIFVADMKRRVEKVIKEFGSDLFSQQERQQKEQQQQDKQQLEKQQLEKQQLEKLRIADKISFTPSSALLAGYPDRIARKVESDEKSDKATYQFPSGRMASLTEETHTYPKYIIAPEADAGERTGRIYEWEAISDDEAERWLFAHAETVTETVFAQVGAGGEGAISSKSTAPKLQKTEIIAYGKIVLKTRKLQAESTDYAQAVCNAVDNFGIEWLPLSNTSKNLLLRVQFYIENSHFDRINEQQETDGCGKKDETSLKSKFLQISKTAKTWLVPFLDTSKNMVTEEMVYNALYWYLEGSSVSKSVPIELTLPNGKTRKLVYEEQNGKIVPVLEVIIQQIFGCMTTPKVMGVPVLLKLLSPARRPLQITNDLESFWSTTWPEVCKEMKGRYPKHNWDYRVVTEE